MHLGTYHRNENEEVDSDKVRWSRTQHAFEHTLRASDFVDEEPIQLEIENAPPVRVHVRYEEDMAPTLTVRLVNDAIHDRSDWAGICDSTMFQVGISLEPQGGQ